MEFREFSEFDDPLSKDYDIQSSLHGIGEPANLCATAYDDLDPCLFDDENIALTLQYYNYDYRQLLALLMGVDLLIEKTEILERCGLSEEELANPDAEIFERVRKYIMHGESTKK